MILAADIGGTKTNLALYDWTTERVDPVREKTYPSADYRSFEEILKEFLEPPTPRLSEAAEEVTGSPEAGGGKDERPDLADEHRTPSAIDAAGFGVAGPVLNNRCQATNLPWVVDGGELSRAFGIPTVRLLNDLEATAKGVLLLRPDEVLSLNAGSPTAKGTIALLAAGTGLGEAILFWDGVRHHPMPSEGGHASFAPNSDQEIELLRYIRGNYVHVSCERVLSGAGLHAIYEFLRDTKKNEPTWVAERIRVGDPAAVIAEIGLAGQAEICVQALDLFVAIYGAEAANLALKTLALGGVYVGGGIAPKILPKLTEPTFMRAFTNKGRYKRLLSGLPVRVILNDKTALLGAAAAAAELTGSRG